MDRVLTDTRAMVNGANTSVTPEDPVARDVAPRLVAGLIMSARAVKRDTNGTVSIIAMKVLIDSDPS